MRRSTYTAYKTTSHIKLIKFFALLGVLSSFVYLIYYAATNQTTIANQPENVPLVEASQSPVKERAENPGGMIIPNENKRVFDLLERTSPKNLSLEKEELCAGSSGDVLCNKDIDPISVAKKVEEKAEVKENNVDTSNVQVKKVEEKSLIAELVQKVEAQEIASKEEAVKKKITQSTVVKGSPTPKGIGYGIQLASYGSLKNANTGAEYYTKKMGDLLDTLEYHTERVTVKGKQYYRVQMFGLVSNAEAKSLCAQIKAKGEGCMPVVR